MQYLISLIVLEKNWDNKAEDFKDEKILGDKRFAN